MKIYLSRLTCGNSGEIIECYYPGFRCALCKERNTGWTEEVDVTPEELVQLINSFKYIIKLKKMERIDINSFIVSLYNKFQETEFGCGIEEALKEQGLSIINNEIKNAPKLRIEKGKWYMCIDDCLDDTDETLYYKKGKLYYCHEDNKLTNELGNPIHYWFDDDEPWLSFRLATDEEIIYNNENKPKFKLFDWIVDRLYMKCGQIISIDENKKTYKIEFTDDTVIYVSYPLDDRFELWKPDNIKSGDIITYKVQENHETIAIVKSIDNERIFYSIWAEPHNNRYQECNNDIKPWSSKNEIFENSNIHPANKMERKYILNVINKIGYK